jgi:predicted ester cyclase
MNFKATLTHRSSDYFLKVLGYRTYAQCVTEKEGGNPLVSEKNKVLIRRCADEIFIKGKLDLVGELLGAGYVNHALPPGIPPGPEGYKLGIKMFHAAFGDIDMTFEDQIAEGDKVVTRFITRCTHKGEWMGVQPTGKQITITGIAIARISNGKIVEEWENADELGMWVQLGALSRPGQGVGL